MHQELTSLICLFHDRDQAQSAFKEILAANVPQDKVMLIGRNKPGDSSSVAKLTEFGLPNNDLHHLLNGLERDGVVLAVSSLSHLVEKVEAIFAAHQAKPVDEDAQDADRGVPFAARPRIRREDAEVVTVDDHAVIPVVREDLQVSKRTVDAGGVRIYRRVVAVPVEQQIALEEHRVQIERNPVHRAATEHERALGSEQTIELTETREELVVTKAARVIEEVTFGREASQRVERVQETVRHTEIEVEQIAPDRSDRHAAVEPGGSAEPI